jgi:DNA-binding PadR family transcriptional regulator
MLAVASLTPQSRRELQHQLPFPVANSTAGRAVDTLVSEGLYNVTRPPRKGRLPGLYTLSRAGEAELDRLFMEARL